MCIDGGTWEKKLKTENPKINRTLFIHLSSSGDRVKMLPFNVTIV